jgi:nitrogen regulatory protein P-II 1
MHKMIMSVIERELLEQVTAEMRKQGVHFTYSAVKGCGKEVRLYCKDTIDRIKIEVVAEEHDVEKVKQIILSHVPLGTPGAGMLAVYPLEEFMEFSEMK